MNLPTVIPARERMKKLANWLKCWKSAPQRRSREGGNPSKMLFQPQKWIPAFAGMALVAHRTGHSACAGTRGRLAACCLAPILLAPAPANAWSLWNAMFEQISIKPQEKPMPFPQRSVPVPGTATMRVQDQESAASLTNPVKPTAELINTGKQLFAIYCTPCHGASGTGNGLVGEKLTVRPFDLTSDAVQSLSDGFIFGYLTFRGSVMPSYANDLSPTERWHMINYLRHGLTPAAPQQAENQAK